MPGERTCLGSAPAPGAVCRALAENPGASGALDPSNRMARNQRPLVYGWCLAAPPARFHISLGQRPRYRNVIPARAESPFHQPAAASSFNHSTLAIESRTNRAVGAHGFVAATTRGFAPGCYKSGLWPMCGIEPGSANGAFSYQPGATPQVPERNPGKG